MIPLDVIICQENISLYRRLLADRNTKGGRRGMIGKMLAEEEAKLLTLFNNATSPREASNDPFVARANINHYLSVLYDTDLAPEKRATVTKLLIQEEDNFGRDAQQLRFAEKRAAEGRDRLNHLRSRLDLTPERLRVEALRVIANVEAIQHLLEGFCHQLRDRVSNRI
jgi:hypothetical protein